MYVADRLVELIQSKLHDSKGIFEGVETEEDIIERIDDIGRANLQPFPIGEVGCFIGGAGMLCLRE